MNTDSDMLRMQMNSGMCVDVLQTCVEVSAKWKCGKRETLILTKTEFAHALEKRWCFSGKRMIQDIKIGGMYRVTSLWRSFQTQLDLLFRDAVFALSDLFFQPSLWRCPLPLPFGSAQFVWFSAGSQWGLCLCTTTQEADTLAKVLDCVCMSECVSTDPQECCPPGLPGDRQKPRTVWQVCLNAAGRPVLRDDGRTPSHHHQVVCAHWLLLGLFLQVLVFVIAQPRDGLKVAITQRAKISWSQVSCLQ